MSAEAESFLGNKTIFYKTIKGETLFYWNSFRLEILFQANIIYSVHDDHCIAFRYVLILLQNKDLYVYLYTHSIQVNSARISCFFFPPGLHISLINNWFISSLITVRTSYYQTLVILAYETSNESAVNLNAHTLQLNISIFLQYILHPNLTICTLFFILFYYMH